MREKTTHPTLDNKVTYTSSSKGFRGKLGKPNLDANNNTSCFSRLGNDSTNAAPLKNGDLLRPTPLLPDSVAKST